VLFPGNVYVYGEDAPADFGPHLPSAAQNPLGRVRVAAEAALRASGVQVILLRAGDFLDTEASGNWFDIKIAESLPRGYLTYPGDPDSPHAWAYLPDVARACVALAEKRVDLPQYSEIAFPGYTLTGRELAQLCTDAMGRPVAVRTMALWPLRLLAPFVPMIRHLLEMSYLWRKPHHLTRESFDAVLPGFRSTPVEEAIARAIAPLVKTDPDRSTPTDAAPHPA
jgi:nucleoside-diphosphate-sugar epimerase